MEKTLLSKMVCLDGNFLEKFAPRFVSSSHTIRFLRLELCLSVFSLLFLADNNPTYGKKLMLKDKCDLSISRHVRYVVDAKAVT